MPQRRLDGRNGAIWRGYISGKTQEALAEEHDISGVRVGQIIAAVRAAIPEPDRRELITESLDLIKLVKQRSLEIADLVGAPIAVGKDGEILYDPETGQVVRDWSGRLAALNMALKADDTISRRMGLDSAQKVELSGGVKFEVAGVDPEVDLR